MRFESNAQDGFVYEMMETMVSATEIFNTVLLHNLEKYFGIHLCIYRGENESDFSDQELINFEKIYEYIARTFKSFKALEKPQNCIRHQG